MHISYYSLTCGLHLPGMHARMRLPGKENDTARTSVL